MNLVRHQCPVCGATHEVTAIRAQLAYGRQLSCSGDCEAERRRRRRARYRRPAHLAHFGESGRAQSGRIPAEASTT